MSKTPHSDAEEAGRLAGLGTGILTGAQVGTALIPIPVVGTLTGAIVGGVLGSRLGQHIAPTVVSTVDRVVDGVSQAVQPLVGGQPAPQAPKGSPGNADFLAQLEQLAQLRSQGYLTEEEFAAAKARLLNR